MVQRLSGHVALVTRGAGGIGAAAATALAGAGAAVMISDLLSEAGERAAAHLRDRGHNMRFYRHDVTDERA